MISRQMIRRAMGQKLQAARLIAANELRMFLRSRRTVITTFLLPVLAWPVVALVSQLGARAYEARRPERQITVAFAGADALDQASEIQGRCSPLGIEVAAGQTRSTLVTAEEADRLIKTTVDVVLAIDGSSFELFESFDLERSRRAADLLERCLEVFQTTRRDELLREKVTDASWSALLDGKIVDTSQPGMRSRRFLGNLLPIVFLGFVLSGGSLVAFSTLAGERESGTLETLLSSSAERLEIVAGKAIAVFVLALAVALVQLGNIAFWLGLVQPESSSAAAQRMGPLLHPASWLGLAALLLPLALVVSSLLLLLSCYARTYREAQQMFYPLLIVTAVPALLGYWPDADTSLAAHLLPIGNTTIAVRDLLLGELGALRLAANVVFNLGLTAIILLQTTRSLNREGAMLRSSEELLGNRSFTRALARTLPVIGSLWLISAWFRSNAPTHFESWPAWVYAIMLTVASGMLIPRLGELLRFPKPSGRLFFELTAAALFGVGLFYIARPDLHTWWHLESARPGTFLALLAVMAAEELFFRGALSRGHSLELMAPVSVLTFCLFAPAGSSWTALILGVALTATAAIRKPLIYVIVARLAFELAPLIEGGVAG